VATDGSLIADMRLACWIIMVAATHSQQMKYL